MNSQNFRSETARVTRPLYHILKEHSRGDSDLTIPVRKGLHLLQLVNTLCKESGGWNVTLIAENNEITEIELSDIKSSVSWELDCEELLVTGGEDTFRDLRKLQDSISAPSLSEVICAATDLLGRFTRAAGRHPSAWVRLKVPLLHASRVRQEAQMLNLPELRMIAEDTMKPPTVRIYPTGQYPV
jgi:hypothetical protein